MCDDIIIRLEREALREPHEPIWMDAIDEILRLREAVLVLTRETEDSEYVAGADRRQG